MSGEARRARRSDEDGRAQACRSDMMHLKIAPFRAHRFGLLQDTPIADDIQCQVESTMLSVERPNWHSTASFAVSPPSPPLHEIFDEDISVLEPLADALDDVV